MTAEGKRSVTIECPGCAHSWRVGEKEDITADKTCSACGHTWTPELADYSKAVRRATKGAVKQTAAAAAAPRIDVAAIFAARNRDRVDRASATDPGAFYRERNARGK